jgi:hypothetical protein
MTDQKAFSDHIDKMLFIKRLQSRENLFNKFLTGDGVLPSGGGLARGLGLPSGGGLDNSGFKNRRPAIQAEMLSTTKDEDEIQAEENYVQLSSVATEKTKKDEYGEKQMVTKDKKTGNIKEIKLNGTTKSIWGKNETLAIVEKSQNDMDNYEKKQNDPKNFHGTTSKAVIFEKDGIVSKYKSISELGKAIKMSKYQILKGFKPKKNGDSFYHEKLGAKLTFVNRSEL